MLNIFVNYADNDSYKYPFLWFIYDKETEENETYMSFLENKYS